MRPEPKCIDNLCQVISPKGTSSVWNRHEGSNFTECWQQVARLCQLRELCRTITEPSAVAPDAKVYVGDKVGNTLNTQLDVSIRRYRARFCNRLFFLLNFRRLITCRFHYQTEPVPYLIAN